MLIFAIIGLGCIAGYLANAILGGGMYPENWAEVLVAGLVGGAIRVRQQVEEQGGGVHRTEHVRGVVGLHRRELHGRRALLGECPQPTADDDLAIARCAEYLEDRGEVVAGARGQVDLAVVRAMAAS